MVGDPQAPKTSQLALERGKHCPLGYSALRAVVSDTAGKAAKSLPNRGSPGVFHARGNGSWQV